MNTRFLKHSLVAASALAGILALSPVSESLAGETNVTLGNGDTATVQGGGTTVRIDSDGNVVVRTDDKTNVDVSLAAGGDEAAAMQIGQMITGKGVFVGTWEPQDRDGNSLGKTFNLYAAPEDIGVLATFNDAVRHVAGLRNWHGHDGFNHNVNGNASCAPLYDTLKDGSYNGEWFIPPLDAVQGNLYANKDAFEPENALVTEYGSDDAHWYWSCTEPRVNASLVYGVAFTGGGGGWGHKDTISLSGRVVRAEPVAP